MEIFFTMLLISLSVGICIMLFLIFLLGNMPIHLIMYIVGYLALLTFLVRLDDFLIVVRVLVECLELEKAETKYYIVKASDIKLSPWLLSGKYGYKWVFYEYEGKSRRRIIWANVMVRSKDYRLLLLVPENKQKNIYAFPLVNFLDVLN